MLSLNESNFPTEIVDWFLDHEKAVDINKKSYESFLARLKTDKEARNDFAWVIGSSGLPWMPLSIDFPHEAMLAEAKAVRDRFVSHRSGVEGGGYVDGNKGWMALSLHGISSEKTYSFNTYGYASEREVPYRWTDVSEICPVTTSFFKKVYPCSTYYRVRYTLMLPGGYIYPHVDRQESALWEVNLALQNPVGFYFKIKDGGYIPFQNGRGFILDVSKLHAVVNMSDEERVHMIVHGYPLKEKKFQTMIEKSYKHMLQNPERFWNM